MARVEAWRVDSPTLCRPTVTSVSPNTGSTAGGTTVTIYRDELCAGRHGDVWRGGGHQCGGGKQHNDHGDDSGGRRRCGDRDGHGHRAEWKPHGGFTYVITNIVTAPSNFTGALSGTSFPTYVSGQQYYNATAGMSFTFAPFNSTGTDLLVMFLGSHNLTVFTITDSYGNTWLPLAGPAYNVGTAGYSPGKANSFTSRMQKLERGIRLR